jgi:G protein beta subunit-like protein
LNIAKPCRSFYVQVRSSYPTACEVQTANTSSWVRSYDPVCLIRCSLSLPVHSHSDQSFWEALSGICSRTIPHPDSQVNRLCISPDKRYLAAAGHHTVKLYDIKSTNPNAILTFDGHTSNITGVAFHCESKWLVTSSEDGTVKIWDTRSGNVQRNYTHGVPVNDVVIHPNQGELISCDRGGNVRIWDLGENKCSHQLIPEDDVSVASVTVASDGSMVCAGNNAVRLFNPSQLVAQH